MWGASARAHVHASFARWCLHARSSIADQGVILVLSHVVSSQVSGHINPRPAGEGGGGETARLSIS